MPAVVVLLPGAVEVVVGADVVDVVGAGLVVDVVEVAVVGGALGSANEMGIRAKTIGGPGWSRVVRT